MFIAGHIFVHDHCTFEYVLDVDIVSAIKETRLYWGDNGIIFSSNAAVVNPRVAVAFGVEGVDKRGVGQ